MERHLLMENKQAEIGIMDNFLIVVLQHIN